MDNVLKNIGDLALFVNAVEAGGISRCAEAMGYERTTVSRRLSKLEARLGVSLLKRTPKGIWLTDAGRRCFQECSFIITAARRATDAAKFGKFTRSKSIVKFGAPAGAISAFVTSVLADFKHENPDLSVEILPISTWSGDLASEIEIGLTFEDVPEAASWSLSLGRASESVCGSSSFVAGLEGCIVPDDIAGVACVVDKAFNRSECWRFETASESSAVTMQNMRIVSSILEVKDAVLAGFGIGRLPNFMCEREIHSGQIATILDDFPLVGREASLFASKFAVNRPEVARLRNFLGRSLAQKMT